MESDCGGFARWRQERAHAQRNDAFSQVWPNLPRVRDIHRGHTDHRVVQQSR